MLGILIYCIGIMYTPGPVNILSLNIGIQHPPAKHISFCLGVACALFFWFLLIGYTGSTVINGKAMPIIAAAGTCFICYLAFKIIAAEVKTTDENSLSPVGFKEGFLMQLLNPKSFLAVLPVTTVQFPAAGIDGAAIALWSSGLGLLGFGAPFVYAVFGSTVTRHISGSSYFKYFNLVMGVMLLAVAVDMAYEHVYLAL